MSGVRTLIVGGGVAGLATAWWLGRRGASGVTLIEREPVLGAHSSGKSAAILRSAMSEPAIRALSLEGSHFLRNPPQGFARHPLIEACGVLLVADARDSAKLDLWKSALEGELEVRDLDERAARMLAPHWRGPIARALFIPEEGRIDTAELVDAFARGARAAGVAIELGRTVRELVVVERRVVGVLFDDGTRIESERVVLAAGGWAGKLAARAGSRIEFRPTRRHLLVTAVDPRIDARWPIVWALGREFYARPESGGMMLCACDETDVDPDRLREDDRVRESIARKASELLHDFADAGAAHFWCGMRSFAADREFLIGPDPDLEGLIWVAGLGGHGLTTSAAVGRLAAEWIVDGASRDPHAATFAPSRFAEGAQR